MYIQAVSAMESLKMESPVKMQKLVTEENKENLEAAYEADEVAVPIKGIPDLPEPEQEAPEPTVASSIKPEEKEEPILQENPQRFVLFPIKYHEVSAFKTTRDSTR
jgi:ribonucleoside-diphosphate reductase subunit M2